MQQQNRWLYGFVWLVVSHIVSAESASLKQLNQEIEQQKKQNNPTALYQYLKLQAEQFQEEPQYDYLLGLAALEAGLNQEAILALERVVLMQPSFAGAWLDLSIAYYRAGDLQTAQQLIQHIEENFSPPENLLVELQKAKKLIRQNSLTSAWRTEVSMLAGRIRNANYGINATTLQLTPLDGGLINAQLSSDLKPRADSAYEGRFATSRRFQHQNGAFSDIQLAARIRDYANEDNQSFMDLAGNWAYLHPIKDLKGGFAVLGANHRQIVLHGKNLGSFTTISVGMKQYFGRCGASIRHEHEVRKYHDLGLYDATIPWITLGAECYGDRWNTQLDYRYGWDQPDGDRVGGTTKRQEFSAIVRWDISEKIFVRGIGYLASYEDQQGFSPIIKFGEDRYIHRVGQRLELSWKLPESIGIGWYGLLELDNVDSYSNIPLSRYDDTQVFAGFRYQFY